MRSQTHLSYDRVSPNSFRVSHTVAWWRSDSQRADDQHDERAEAEFGDDVAHQFVESCVLLIIALARKSELWLETKKVPCAQTDHDEKQEQFQHKQASVSARDECAEAPDEKITAHQTRFRESAHNKQTQRGKPARYRTGGLDA